MDLSLWIALIALLLSILSPLMTAVINNIFSLKIKKADLYEARRLDAIEKYIYHASCVSSKKAIYPTTDSYRQSSKTVLLYTSSKEWALIDEFNEHLKNDNLLEAKIILDKLCKKFDRLK